MKLDSIVCFKWEPPAGFRTHFTGNHVNVLRSMVKRNYDRPHKFICVTDKADGIDSDIEIVPLWKDHSGVVSPMGRNQPSCYRRLKMFSPEAENYFGKRFVSLDLDTVIVNDMIPVWERPEEFMIWGDTAKGTPYNGSMIMMTAGSRKQVWERFDPRLSPNVGKKLGFIGSDQAWIGVCLGKGEKIWTKTDGVVSFRNELANKRNYTLDGVRIVFFHGTPKAWDAHVQKAHPWVKDHWK